MGARESVLLPNGPCPVTDAAGSVVRRRDIAGFSLSEAVYAKGTTLPRHCHAHCYLTLVLAGNYSEKHSRQEFSWSEGALHLLPAGERHENEFESAARLLRVKIEPAAIHGWGSEYGRFLSEPREISGPLAGWLANRMTREFQAQDDVAPLAMEGVLLEMLAESARAADETRGAGAPGWLRRIRDVLQESYSEAPGLSILAGIAGVHPVHLSREFHKHYGMTIGEFVRTRRVERASELLSKSHLSLAEIAAACGFSDQSHFCALFKKHSGMTPAKFRRLSSDMPLRAVAGER
ncbi:MAG TPA: helix-turn-helix transcriptional regulator [Bryobacteraceae bacterium]|nr:helix-turn-helix transcriptional regulator [Bryobacteraceae bacterium]